MRRSDKECEDECFVCNDGGELMVCDVPNCPKVYHLECVGLKEWPNGERLALPSPINNYYRHRHLYLCHRSIISSFQKFGFARGIDALCATKLLKDVASFVLPPFAFLILTTTCFPTIMAVFSVANTTQMRLNRFSLFVKLPTSIEIRL